VAGESVATFRLEGAPIPDAVLACATGAALKATEQGHWGAEYADSKLRELNVTVHATPTWRAYGAEVAGLAWPPHQSIEVGSDLAALAHEMAETVFWEWPARPAGLPDFHSVDWPGLARVQSAVDSYGAILAECKR
jgi:hypothetical protein